MIENSYFLKYQDTVFVQPLNTHNTVRPLLHHDPCLLAIRSLTRMSTWGVGLQFWGSYRLAHMTSAFSSHVPTLSPCRPSPPIHESTVPVCCLIFFSSFRFQVRFFPLSHNHHLYIGSPNCTTVLLVSCVLHPNLLQFFAELSNAN